MLTHKKTCDLQTFHTLACVPSRLKELLGSHNNTIQLKLWLLPDLASKPHVLERILDVKMKHLHFKTIRE